MRAADLRFTPDEAAAYLTEVMGLALTAARCRGARRAHRGMDRRAAAGRAVDAGPGRRRRVHRRLRRRRPLHRRLSRRGSAAAPARARSASFLLRTSILDRLTGPLCDAVTGRADGKAMLEALDRAQPLPHPARRPSPVVPLSPPVRGRAAGTPGRRTAGRRRGPAPAGQRLVRAERRPVRRGRTRAGRRGLRARGRAGRADMPALQQDRQEATMRRWLEALPDEVLRIRPVLSVGYAAALMVSGETDGRGGATAGRRALVQRARRHGRPRPPIGRDGGRRRGGLPPNARCDRPVPRRRRRCCPATWRHHDARPAGARPRRRRRPSRARRGGRSVWGSPTGRRGDLEAAPPLVGRRRRRAWSRPGTCPT